MGTDCLKLSKKPSKQDRENDDHPREDTINKEMQNALVALPSGIEIYEYILCYVDDILAAAIDP